MTQPNAPAGYASTAVWESFCLWMAARYAETLAWPTVWWSLWEAWRDGFSKGLFESEQEEEA